MDHVPPARKYDAGDTGAPAGGALTRGLLLGLCLILAALFGALSVWQVERLGRKRDLIATVEARLAAPPVAPPGPAAWSPDQAYMRVAVSGVFMHDRSVLAQAVTERGAGWWLMTPLQSDRGVIFVNRGFVPARDWRPADPTPRRVEVTGLLRASEPDGGFLRANDPEAGRWHSRDVSAMARAKGLAGVAPYFIDADAAANSGDYPVGGLTVVRFRNSHLSYAITWLLLCGLSLAGAVIVLRTERRG